MSHPFGRQPDQHENEDEQLALAMAEMAYPPAPGWVLALAVGILVGMLLGGLFLK